MDAIRSSFEHAFGRVMGQAMGELLVWGFLLLVFISVFLLVLYLFARSTGGGFNIRFGRGDEGGVTPTQALSASTAPPASGPDSERLGHYVTTPATPADATSGRKAFLKTLDSVERVVAIIYLVLLCLVLAAVTAAMAWVYFRYSNDANRDHMLLYGGMIYLIVVLGLITQIGATKLRLTGRLERGLFYQLLSKLQMNVQSVPEVLSIDTAALERARRHVAGGGTLEEACALVDPRYREMSGWSKDAFRRAVEMSLDKSA